MDVNRDLIYKALIYISILTVIGTMGYYWVR